MKLLLVILSFIAISGHAQSVPITNFHAVSSGIYRGARPSAEGLQALQAMGVKTILNLEDDNNAIFAESDMAVQLGLHMISIPMSGFWAPSDDTVQTVLEILNAPSSYPIFVHCKHGQDRTGVIFGLFRVWNQGWTPQAAYAEMLQFGFHPSLYFLDRYYREKTGL